MSFIQVDINYLLSFLENELQSNDARISELKSLKSLEFLYNAKYNQLGFGDSGCNRKSSSNESRHSNGQNNPLIQLEDLIATQHEAQMSIKEQIKSYLEKHNAICMKIELENMCHENNIEKNTKSAIQLIQEKEKLNMELKETKFKREQLELDHRQFEKRIDLPKKHKNIINKLVNRRKEILEELQTNCQNCIQLENMIEKAKQEVEKNKGQLEHTKLNISKAIENISLPFHGQASAATAEFALLKSKISDITTSNEHLRLRIKDIKESKEKCDTKVQDPRPADNFAEVRTSCQQDKCANESENIHNSLLATFDSTIKMFEMEIENSSLLRNKHFETPPKFRISAPHPTPIKMNQRISQRVTNFESMMNSNNTQMERPKSSHAYQSVSSSSSSLAHATPPAFITVPKSTLPAAIPSNNESYNGPTLSSNWQPKVPPAPPSSLSSSPVTKKMPTSPTNRGKQPAPPPPIKPPTLIGSKSQQSKPLASVKHLVMPSKT